MIKNIIASIINDIELKESLDDKPRFSSKSYKVDLINKDNFKRIESNLINDTISNQLVFIDGGNSEVLRAANFSLHFIRICALIVKNNKKIKKIINEFYCFAYSREENDEIIYDSKIFQIKGNQIIKDHEILLNSMDETIKQGIFRASVGIIPLIARKFAEHKIIYEVINDLNENDIIIKDGTLEATYTNESELINKIYDECNKQKIHITALAKTSTLFTEKGNNLLGLLNNMSEEDNSFYNIATVNLIRHKADIFAIKLHPKSNFIFRFEVNNNIDYDIHKILNCLVNNSNDPVFLGYPYGLVNVDKFARVSNQEVDYTKTIFSTKFKKHWKKILKYQNSISAHSVLDSI